MTIPPPPPTIPPPERRPERRPELTALGEWARPVSLASEQRLVVLPALVPLLPGGGLRRGSTVTVDGVGGATSLALALVAGASAAGAWVTAVGLPSLGLVAAADVGVALERLVLVAAPEPAAWGTVVAALVDAIDVVLVRPTHRMRPAEARRLASRVRERGGVLVRVGGRADAWPEGTDLHLTAVASAWEGLGRGHGHLRARRVTVEVGGRREAARPRRGELWLPGPDGEVAEVEVAEIGEVRPRPRQAAEPRGA